MRGEIIFHPSRESMESPLPDATAKVTADSCVNVALEQNPRGSWPTPPRNCRNNRIVRWLFPSSDRPEREAEKEGWREKEGERFKRVCERASVTAHQNCREATAITKACCLRLSVPLSNPSKKKKKILSYTLALISFFFHSSSSTFFPSIFRLPLGLFLRCIFIYSPAYNSVMKLLRHFEMRFSSLGDHDGTLAMISIPSIPRLSNTYRRNEEDSAESSVPALRNCA